jgi:hypothetical protein
MTSFLNKFFVRFACFSVYLGVFSRLKQEILIFYSCLQIVIWETLNLRPSRRWLTLLRLLVNLFSWFFLVGSWAASFYFVFDWLFVLEKIYGIINSSSGGNLLFESDSQFPSFPFVESKFWPFSKRLSLGLI